MSWAKIGKTIGKFAPTLGAALGGPAGGVVGSLISTALGVEESPEQVEIALGSNPDAKLKLIELQKTHKERLEAIALDVLTVELSDKQSARENHKHSVMPAVITVMLTLIVSGLLYAIFQDKVPAENSELAMIMFGQVFTLWGASITYWVGTTRSSAEKDRRK